MYINPSYGAFVFMHCSLHISTLKPVG